jgi:hypothetical protein
MGCNGPAATRMPRAVATLLIGCEKATGGVGDPETGGKVLGTCPAPIGRQRLGQWLRRRLPACAVGKGRPAMGPRPCHPWTFLSLARAYRQPGRRGRAPVQAGLQPPWEPGSPRGHAGPRERNTRPGSSIPPKASSGAFSLAAQGGDLKGPPAHGVCPMADAWVPEGAGNVGQPAWLLEPAQGRWVGR